MIVTQKRGLKPIVDTIKDVEPEDSATTPLLQPSDSWVDESQMNRKDLFECAVAHVTDAMAYRDFSNYGEYFVGAPNAEKTRERLRAHSFYYENPGMQAMRTVVAVLFQTLVFFEQPPWCLSNSGIFTNGCNSLPKYHMTPIALLPEVATLAIEIFCLAFLAVEWLLRFRIHGSHFLDRGWVRVEGGLLLANMLGVVTRIAILPLDVHSWFAYPLYLRALLRIAHFVLRSRTHRRDVFGVAFAAKQLVSVLVSLGAALLVFAWAAFVLFAPTYSAAGDPPAVNVALSSFLSAVESFFVLLASATNFPDMMLPAFGANRALAVFFFAFIVCCSWLGQALVLASVFASFKEGAMTHFDMSSQRRRAAVSRAFFAVLGAAQAWEQIPAEVFQEWAGMLHHAFFVKHPQLLRNLTDANHDGEVSKEEFAAISDLLRLEEHVTPVCLASLDPERMAPLRKAVWRLVTSRYYTSTVSLLLVVNGILVWYESVWLDVTRFLQESSTLILADSVVIALFLFDLFCRSVAIGSLKEDWGSSGLMYKFDTVVVLLLGAGQFLFVTQCVALAPCKGSAEAGHMVRALLLLRGFLNLRLFRLSQRFEVLLSTAGTLLPLVMRFVLLLCLLALSFAVIGVALFGGLIHADAPNLPGTPYDPALGAYSYLPVHFNDVTSGVVLLLCALVLNPVVQDTVVDSAGTNWARLYFVAWWLCGVCVLLNVLVSFALECFLDQFEHHEQAARRGSTASVIEDTAEGAVTRVALGGGYLSEEDGEGSMSGESDEIEDQKRRSRRVYKVRRRVSTFTLHSSARAILETPQVASPLSQLGLRPDIIGRTNSAPVNPAIPRDLL